MSAMVWRSLSGANQPPAPSTTTQSAVAANES